MPDNGGNDSEISIAMKAMIQARLDSEAELDPMKRMILDRTRANEIISNIEPCAAIESKLEQKAQSEVVVFKEKLDQLKELLKQGHIQKLKIEPHCAAVLYRLLVTSKQRREVTYGELRNSISQNLRSKFELAVIELRRLDIIKERIQYGKCYYKLNLAMFYKG